jgi:hypothetical protein
MRNIKEKIKINKRTWVYVTLQMSDANWQESLDQNMDFETRKALFGKHKALHVFIFGKKKKSAITSIKK